MIDRNTIIIGIVGPVGVGKSTVADIMRCNIPDSRVMAFADTLKQDVHTWLCGRIGPAFDRLSQDERERMKRHSLGLIYQGYGEIVRTLAGPNYWIERLATQIAIWTANKHTTCVIVPDVRHFNEDSWIRSMGGIIVGVSGVRRGNDTRSTTHPSETSIEMLMREADLAIENYGTMEELIEKTLEILRTIYSSRVK